MPHNDTSHLPVSAVLITLSVHDGYWICHRSLDDACSVEAVWWGMPGQDKEHTDREKTSDYNTAKEGNASRTRVSDKNHGRDGWIWGQHTHSLLVLSCKIRMMLTSSGFEEMSTFSTYGETGPFHLHLTKRCTIHLWENWSAVVYLVLHQHKHCREEMFRTKLHQIWRSWGSVPHNSLWHVS